MSVELVWRSPVDHATTVSAGIWAVWSRVEQSEQTTWITRLREHDERYATSSQVQDEVHVLQRELKTARSMEWLLRTSWVNCARTRALHRHRCRTQRFPSTGALKADTGHIKAHWRAHESPVRLARRSAVLGAVADQQLQRSTRWSQKSSAARSLVLWQASMNRLSWICARRKNVFEMSGKTDDPCHRRADSLKVRLEEARAEHARFQTSNADFEQKWGFMWRRGSCERSSRSGQEELRKGDQLFIERDRELVEVRSQFAELQNLFDEVSHQLYTECKRSWGSAGDRERMRQAKQGTRGHPSQAWGVPSDVVTDARHTSVVSQGEVAESDASDASHETEYCEHTGTRAGCRQTPECKHAMRLRVRWRACWSRLAGRRHHAWSVRSFRWMLRQKPARRTNASRWQGAQDCEATTLCDKSDRSSSGWAARGAQDLPQGLAMGFFASSDRTRCWMC